jgi:hypothetical protein
MSEEIEFGSEDNLSVSLSDDDLISKVTDTENNFIERKTASDTRGWLETTVAFANSCPIGFPGVLYVGVNNDGSIQHHKNPMNFEKLQKTISHVIDDAWPPIYYLSKTLQKHGHEFIAVIVPGSISRPHFSGHSFVRIGPQTKDASEAQFDDLITQRSGKVRALRKLIGRIVYWHAIGYLPGSGNGTVMDCNQFFVTLKDGPERNCFPIDWITISFDPRNERYALVVKS